MSRRFGNTVHSYPLYYLWGITGAIIPDVDYLYQNIFDYQNFDHHYYFSHFPVFWTILLVYSIFMLVLHKKSQTAVLAFMFSLNGFIHMILDSLEGWIFWLAPLSYKGYSVEILLNKYFPSFIEQNPRWSSILEASIFFLALTLFLRSIHGNNRTKTATAD
jgi:inner membrane protein